MSDAFTQTAIAHAQELDEARARILSLEAELRAAKGDAERALRALESAFPFIQEFAGAGNKHAPRTLKMMRNAMAPLAAAPQSAQTRGEEARPEERTPDELPYVVEYTRTNESGWRAMAAFDVEGPAQQYCKDCDASDGKRHWEYRVRSI